jgi:hypothetical protein
MNFYGRVEHVIDKSGTKKDGTPFTATQYVVTETTPSYPQSGLFETYGDRAGTAKVGDEVEVEFNFRCDEYQGKYFGKNSAWKITVKKSAMPTDGDPLAPTQQPIPEATDDLPF